MLWDINQEPLQFKEQVVEQQEGAQPRPSWEPSHATLDGDKTGAIMAGCNSSSASATHSCNPA